MNYNYIHQEFSPAVVRMQDVGTAYLIDSENGYLLTASHVLNDLAGKNEDMRVIMGQPPYSEFSFKVVKQFDPNDTDVALLQLVPPNAMRNTRALDIAFLVPDYDSPLFAMGYPQYGGQAQIILKDGGVSFAGSTPGGIIEINHTTEGGDSGGVLVDEYGDAIAICEEQTAHNAKGRYLPLVSINKILDEIPVSNRMKQLEDQIINGQIDMDSLKQELKKTSKSPSNLEIYIWTQKVNKSPEFMNKIAPYVNCPLLQAFSERHILDAITPFMGRLDPVGKSRANYEMAQKEYSLGNYDEAKKFAQKSASEEGIDFIANTALLGASLYVGAIGDLKNVEGANVIQQDAVPLAATLDSGEVRSYLVQWVATISSQKSEIGHPSEPLKGWLTDTRQCKWSIETEITRKVYFINPQEGFATEQSVSKVFSGGSQNEGSSFVVQTLRSENCNDADARYKKDLNDARSTLMSLFPNTVTKDREVVQADIMRVPHVKKVEVTPSPSHSTARPPDNGSQPPSETHGTTDSVDTRVQRHGTEDAATAVVGKNQVGNITQAPCSVTQIGGQGNQATTNCVTVRSLTPQEKAELVENLKKGPPGIATVWAVETGQNLGMEIYDALKAAGWQMQEPEVQMMFIKNPMHEDIDVFVHGEPGDTGQFSPSDPTTVTLMRSLAALKRFKSGGLARSENVAKGVIKISVGPPVPN